ncbi:MAG: SHOCT domain-containing protein [Bacteroidetes bacterium]|nr:SHOCT domain-containing protein [Bacteroidota bacterium]
MFRHIGAFELLIVIFFWVGPAILAGNIARKKGRSYWGFFLIALVLSWIGLIFAAIAAPAASTTIIQPIDHATSLAKLAELRDAGTLSDSEFELEKAKILNS